MSAQPLPWPPVAADDASEPAVLPFRPRPTQSSPLTLEQAFRQFKLPLLMNPRQKRAKETIGEYWTHLRRWEECPWSDLVGPDGFAQYGTTSPVLPWIDLGHLQFFQDWLAGQLDDDGEPVYSARTINKHLGTVKAILSAAGPYGVQQYPHKLPPLPTNRAGRKLHLSLAEADELKLACRCATWPKHDRIPPPLLWETLVVGFCVYGFRTQEQVRYETDKDPLQWERITDQTAHPGDAKGLHGPVESPCGWLTYTPQKQKRMKPEPLHLPLVACYRAHLDAIRERLENPMQPRGPVFAVPMSNEAFYAQWKAIVARAGIAPKATSTGAQAAYEIRHLRKTAATWIGNHAGKDVAELVLGHADRSVSGTHYVEQAEKVVAALATLPLPESFQRPLFAGDRQLTLF